MLSPIPWSTVDEMAQALDVVVGEQFGKFVALLHRQHGGDGVELFCTALDGRQ
ncbi:hypothetical protein DFI02_1307 [Rhizobium sp. PP-F2F-G20b]|nr:hypothetical protein DFI02_1307 [Rhizobium sp. PP-F2F-G20b]